MTKKTETRRPGRPRDEEVGAAILSAARELVLRDGYEAVTTKMIVDAAGAGKQTLYRRWPSKAELILDAFLEHAKTEVDQPGVGAEQPVAERLIAFLVRTFDALERSGVAMRNLMAAAQSDLEFRSTFRTRFIEPRRAALASLLADGIARGELPPHADTIAATITLYGALWYRLLLNETLDRDFAERLVALTIDGLGKM